MQMTVLRYSRGRGRGTSGPSNYPTRARGGRSGAVRFRSMTWTNPTTRHGRGQNKLPLPEAVPGGQAPKTGINHVCARTSKAGNLVWVNSSNGGNKLSSSTAISISSAHSSGQTRPPVEGYSQRKPPGQIARYSGPRGGRGKVLGGRGMVALRGGRGGTRGYWTPGPWRGLAALRGRMLRSNHSRGRGMRRFFHPSAMLRMRYTASLHSALRFTHPASRSVSRKSLWAFAERWRNPVADSRTRMLPMAKPHFKNLSFIRGVIVQRPVKAVSHSKSPQTVAAAAAARRVAVARRFVHGTLIYSPKKQAGTLTSSGFVHSGGYGMAIRRVGGSHLAVSGAAAASPAKKSETALSVSAAGANQVRRLKALTSENVSTVASRVSKPSHVSSETQQLPIGKAALLRKSRMRTVKSVKASSAVAGARAKKTQVLVRNMTLYRKKGEVVVIDPIGGARDHAGKKAEEKKVKAKTEPCLFFCKFGKCMKSDDECPYVHDKTKVAVCRGFLRGTCKDGDKCPLTHAVQAEKMPVCVFFEKGMCFTANCPYRHVKVSENAAICPHFLKVRCVRELLSLLIVPCVQISTVASNLVVFPL